MDAAQRPPMAPDASQVAETTAPTLSDAARASPPTANARSNATAPMRMAEGDGSEVSRGVMAAPYPADSKEGLPRLGEGAGPWRRGHVAARARAQAWRTMAANWSKSVSFAAITSPDSRMRSPGTTASASPPASRRITRPAAMSQASSRRSQKPS